MKFSKSLPNSIVAASAYDDLIALLGTASKNGCESEDSVADAVNQLESVFCECSSIPICENSLLMPLYRVGNDRSYIFYVSMEEHNSFTTAQQRRETHRHCVKGRLALFYDMDICQRQMRNADQRQQILCKVIRDEPDELLLEDELSSVCRLWADDDIIKSIPLEYLSRAFYKRCACGNARFVEQIYFRGPLRLSDAFMRMQNASDAQERIIFDGKKNNFRAHYFFSLASKLMKGNLNGSSHDCCCCCIEQTAMQLCRDCQWGDDDSQRALVRKDRLRKKLQKNNAEKCAVSYHPDDESVSNRGNSQQVVTDETTIRYGKERATQKTVISPSKKKARKWKRSKKESKSDSGFSDQHSPLGATHDLNESYPIDGGVQHSSDETTVEIARPNDILSSISSSCDYDEVFRPLPQEKIDELNGWEREFEQFKL